MARIDNLNGREMADMKKRQRAQAVATPLANSSITRGGLRVASTEGLKVDGSAKVAGALNVTGSQVVSGTLSVTGTENVSGTLNVAGVLLVDGAAGLNGTLGINGNASIGAGGTLTVGGMVIDPNVSGYGGIRSTGTIYLSAPGVVTTGQITGGALVVIGSALSVTSISTTTSAANCFIDSGGKFFKVTSAARFKIDPQPMSLPDSLLAVPVKDWIDRESHERGEVGPRVPGIIAEEVEAAGGGAFVTHDDDGLIQGVSYDRLALARTEILARQLEAALARIETLEAQIAA